MWMSASTRLLRVERGADLVDVAAVRALADEQALGLDAEDDRDGDQQHADRDRADAIPDRVAGEDGEADAGEGEDQAEERGDVLEQDDRQLGLLGVPDEVDPALLAAHVVRLDHGGAQREALEPDRDDEHDDRQPRHLERRAGASILSMPS